MSVKKLLTEEIESQIGSLEDLPFGSQEYSAGVSDTAKLLDKLNEMERIENEHDEKIIQMHEDKIDRIVKNCLTGVSVVGGMALTVWGTVKSLKFEETGTITTVMGRGFINKLLHKN